MHRAPRVARYSTGQYRPVKTGAGRCRRCRPVQASTDQYRPVQARPGHVASVSSLSGWWARGSSDRCVCHGPPQDSCARVLLFRGAHKDIKNYNNQTAFQVKDHNYPNTPHRPTDKEVP